jgi:uncharacterized protein YpiB (UPF0302 family)
MILLSRFSSAQILLHAANQEEAESIVSSEMRTFGSSRLFKKILGTTDSSVNILNEEGKKLEEILRDTDERKDLIDQMLMQHVESLPKIRFICGIDDMLRTSDDRSKFFKATKLVNCFVKKRDTRHCILDIPVQYQGDLRRLKLEAFQAVRIHYLNVLAQQYRSSGLI